MSVQDGNSWHKRAELNKNDLPAKTAAYFYSIIASGLVLPVLIRVGSAYMGAVGTFTLMAFALTLLGGLALAYHRFLTQIKELERAIDRVEYLGEGCRISLLGGLVHIEIEQKVNGRSFSPVELPGQVGAPGDPYDRSRIQDDDGTTPSHHESM